MGAVIAAFKLNKPVAVGMGTCNADGMHGAFGATIGEPHHISAGHSDESFGGLHLMDVCESVDIAILHGFGHSLGNAGVGMAKDNWAKP